MSVAVEDPAMTDFSRNQISSIQLKNNQVDRWVVPNDRQLCLRAKLGTGWSVRTNKSDSYSFHDALPHSFSDDELDHIQQVVQKAAMLDSTERQRIGTLVNHYQRLKDRCRGDGAISCFLCNVQFYKFRSNSKICSDCANAVCTECLVETTSSENEKVLLCKICSEKRELWKKSGAWFYGNIPPHTDVVELPAVNFRESMRPLTPQGTPIPARKAIEAAEIPSVGFGQEIEVQVVKCKPDFDEDESDSSTESVTSYNDSVQKFKTGTDSDSVSLSSHLKSNPLLSMKGEDSSSTVTAEETMATPVVEDKEFSATESLQDLRQISVHSSSSADQTSLSTVEERPRPTVSFYPRAPSPAERAQTLVSSAKARFEEGMPRCVSIPNADLTDVNYEAETDTESPYGSLVFTLFYQEEDENLQIELLEAQNLAHHGGAANFHVTLNLVPSYGMSRKLKSHSEQGHKDIKWKEKLSYFGVSSGDLLYKCLVFSIMEERLLGSNNVAAGLRMPLRQLNSHELTHYHVYLEKKATLPCDEARVETDRGKIQLAIRFDTHSSQLFVGIVRCAALSVPSRDGVADPYVKVYLQPDQSKSGKRKTGVKKGTLNPEFHEEFIFKASLVSLSNRCLEITVWDHHVTRNIFLGGVSLGLHQHRSKWEKRQWSTIINNPNRRHDSWLQLRDLSIK